MFSTIKDNAREDFIRSLSTGLNMYCNHLVYPMINASAEMHEKYPEPHLRTFESIFGGLTTLLLAEYFRTVPLGRQAQVFSAHDYPSSERQLQLSKNIRIMDSVLAVWSTVPIRSLFEAIARHNLNTTEVFQEYCWSDREISEELRQLELKRKLFAPYVSDDDLLLVDQLGAFQKKLLNPLGLEPGERIEDLEEYFYP